MSDETPDVQTLFKMLGIDIDDQVQVNQLRADLVYARRLRRTAEAGRRHAFKLVVTAVVLALAAALADTVRRWLAGIAP